MAKPNQLALSLVGLAVILLFHGKGTEALKMQVFKDMNFAGLIYEAETDEEGCHDVAPYARGDAGSIDTDTCLMIYERPGCLGNSFKLSLDMGEELRDLRKPISSFHPCNETYGGGKILVDMFNEGALIGEYHDVCGCQDLPSEVSTRLTRLDNHGNCIQVYETSSCSGSSSEIPAGQSLLSQDLPKLGYYIRSVSGCGPASRRKCVKLSSKVYKFVILDADPDAPSPIPQQVEMATSTLFFNNGSATVSQEYEARKVLRERTMIEHSSTLKQMDQHVVEKTKTIETKTTIKILFVKIERTVTETFKDTYTYEDTEENSSKETFVKETEKEYVVKQRFEVPPCVQYEVSSAVSTLNDYPLKYEVYAKVTGEESGRKLTAEEVKGQVDGMTFVEMMDEYTAVFKSTHRLFVSLGVDTVITGQGSDIPGCERLYGPENKKEPMSFRYSDN